MPEIGSIAYIAQTIQLAIAPVFLLAGIGSILNVLSGRLARAVDRARRLESLHADSEGDEHARYVMELRVLSRRISLVSDAVFLCVASAIMICGVVALMFIANLSHLNLADLLALMFILAMVLLVAGLVLFSIEVRAATRSIAVREELLERD